MESFLWNAHFGSIGYIHDLLYALMFTRYGLQFTFIEVCVYKRLYIFGEKAGRKFYTSQSRSSQTFLLIWSVFCSGWTATAQTKPNQTTRHDECHAWEACRSVSAHGRESLLRQDVDRWRGGSRRGRRILNIRPWPRWSTRTWIVHAAGRNNYFAILAYSASAWRVL